jgi:uncharacterized membrane protein
MTSIFANRITIIWALLVVASLLSWESMDIAGDHARIARAAILVIAFVKVSGVGLEFMELRHAPLALRIGFEAWCVLVCGALLVLFW